MKHQTEQERYNMIIIEYNYKRGPCVKGENNSMCGPPRCEHCAAEDERHYSAVMSCVGQRILNMKKAKTRTFITSVATLAVHTETGDPVEFKFKGREYQTAENVGKDYFDAISYYHGEHVSFPLYEIQVVSGKSKDNGMDMQINLRGYDRKLVVLTVRPR